MTWVRIALVALGLVEGAWMTLDGARALTLGDTSRRRAERTPANSVRGTTLLVPSVFLPDRLR